MLSWYMLWLCLSIHLTFKGQYCTRMAKHKITVFCFPLCVVVKYYTVKHSEPCAKYVHPFLLCRTYCILCVCLTTCLLMLFIFSVSDKPHVQISQNFLYMLPVPVAVARSSSVSMLCTSSFVNDVG